MFEEVSLVGTMSWIGTCTNESIGWRKRTLKELKSVSHISTSIVQDAHNTTSFIIVAPIVSPSRQPYQNEWAPVLSRHQQMPPNSYLLSLSLP